MPGPQDKAVTILGSTTACNSVQFTRVNVTTIVNNLPVVTAEIQATAYGTADASDGSKGSEIATWILSGAAKTTVLNFMNAQAAVKLREKMGLEAP